MKQLGEKKNDERLRQTERPQTSGGGKKSCRNAQEKTGGPHAWRSGSRRHLHTPLTRQSFARLPNARRKENDALFAEERAARKEDHQKVLAAMAMGAALVHCYDASWWKKLKQMLERP